MMRSCSFAFFGLPLARHSGGPVAADRYSLMDVIGERGMSFSDYIPGVVVFNARIFIVHSSLLLIRQRSFTTISNLGRCRIWW